MHDNVASQTVANLHLCAPAGRYGDGTVRLTVEQDIIFPFIPNDKVEEMSAEPIFQKYLIEAGNLTRGLVSCTGAQVGVKLVACST